MVFDENDPSQRTGLEPSDLPPQNDQPSAFEDRLASPLDRLAANVADFVIVSPLATLAMAPFHKMAEEANLQGQDDQWLYATLMAFGAAILLVIAYQTFFLIKWRATPGKRLMGLTVESLWQNEGEPMRSQSAFLRSVACCFEAALCGLPWIAVIGNDRRRPFHDRLADTIVLSKRQTRIGPPGLSEKSLASGLVGAFFMSLLIIVVFKFGALKPATVVKDESDTTVAACDLVDHAEKSWIEGLGEKKPSRMSIALSLYEAEAIDEDCLKSEAEASLWKAGDKDLSYLARGLAEKADDELSQSYINKACDGSKPTDACKALAFLNENDLPDDPVEAKSAKVARENDLATLIGSLNPKSEPFLKILAIRELTSRRQFSEALTMIDSFSPQHDLSFFLSSERMKTLWALNRKPEARLSLQAAVAGYDSDQRVAITRWFCQSETREAGCTPQAKSSCDLLASTVEHDKVLLGDPEVTLTYLHGELCEGRLTDQKLVELKNEMPDLASQTFIDALISISKGDESKGRKLLKGIAAKGEDAGPFFIESQVRLMDLAKTEKELSALRETWVDSDSNADGWSFVGRHLMDRYNQFKAWDQTIEVGFKLGESDPLDTPAARAFVVAAYRSGQTKLAMGYLQTYFGASQDERNFETHGESINNERLPASVDGFDEVVRGIHSDLENGGVQRHPQRRPSGSVSTAVARTVAGRMPTKLPPKRRRGAK
jgi:uncharacterized RDD family membrane protein YckC